MQGTNPRDFGWFSIIRLGLVQTALGAVVVLTTSTLNRVMVVELALAAVVPGALVTLHHAMQLLRPRMGYGSDVGQRRTPWIVGGMLSLAVGGVGASAATMVMASHTALGLALGVVAYALIGGGVSACGTSLLVLMAKRVAAPRRAAAATVVWLMMIAGFAITATVVGGLLDPFSYPRLIAVTGGVSAIAMVVTLGAMWRLEGASLEATEDAAVTKGGTHSRAQFWTALREVWSEPHARRFTLFVFVSMLAYSAQDLILEPFAGAVFGWTPGESTQLAGAQHGGVFARDAARGGRHERSSRTPPSRPSRAGSSVGCLASGVAMAGLFVAGMRKAAPGHSRRTSSSSG